MWNAKPVIMIPGAPYDAVNFWSFQPWAIVDPRPQAELTGPRIRNFLLPMNPLGPNPSAFTAGDLFCSGHAWTPWGDLVVAGGVFFSLNPPGFIQANMTMLFQPDRPSQRWPLVTASGEVIDGPSTGPLQTPQLYSDFGHWHYGPDLLTSRYYPTVTLTQRLPRLATLADPLGLETVVVSGGTQDFLNPVPAANASWNNYEAIRLTDLGVNPVSSDPIEIDAITLSGTVHRLFAGPGDQALLTPYEQTWLTEYPRLNMLSDGTLFLSGYAPKSAKVNHNVPPLPNPVPGSAWDTSVGAGTSAGLVRHDGSTVFFARWNGTDNIVIRMGGQQAAGSPCAVTATNSMEVLLDAAIPGSQWLPLNPQLPRPMYHGNAVILPNAAIVVVGGTDGQCPQLCLTPPPLPVVPPLPDDTCFHHRPLLFEELSWSELSLHNTNRGYHSTAVLLPSGKLLVAGGELRHNHSQFAPTYDYEVLHMPYQVGSPPSPQPTNMALAAAPGVTFVNGGWELDSPHGAAFQLTCSLIKPLRATKVVLMAPGSITHHSDMSARYIELDTSNFTFTSAQTQSITFTIPAEAQAPRGKYMLFALTSGGIPSDAIWVHLL